MKEIEKKYLVNDLPNLSECRKYHIVQGYLKSDETGEIRIRLTDNECFLTSKGDGSLVRDEEEVCVPESTLKILYGLVKGRFIEKTRYLIPIYGGYTAELDVYENDLDGLLTVEVEFPSLEDANDFIPPIWFGDEVTNDKRFKNKNLAMSGASPAELISKDIKLRELK